MTITHMTQREVADRLKISPRTLERWRVTGEVQLKFIKCGSAVRYRVVDVEEFEERQLRAHTGQLAPYAGHPSLKDR